MENPLAQGNSFIHQLDPRIRILSGLAVSFAAAVATHFPGALGFLALGSVLVCLARVPFAFLVQRLKPLLWFLAMIWVFLPLTFSQDIVYSHGIFRISMAGVVLSMMITVKSIAIVFTFTALILTMPMDVLGKGLHQIRVPDKLVFLLLMTFRYIFVIQEEYQRLLRAARFRGFVSKTSLHSYKTYAYLAGMLFVRASLRARRVYQAMRCRGFNQKFHTLATFAPNAWNPYFCMCMIAAAIGLTLIDRIWIFKWPL